MAGRVARERTCCPKSRVLTESAARLKARTGTKMFWLRLSSELNGSGGNDRGWQHGLLLFEQQITPGGIPRQIAVSSPTRPVIEHDQAGVGICDANKASQARIKNNGRNDHLMRLSTPVISVRSDKTAVIIVKHRERGQTIGCSNDKVEVGLQNGLCFHGRFFRSAPSLRRACKFRARSRTYFQKPLCLLSWPTKTARRLAVGSQARRFAGRR